MANFKPAFQQMIKREGGYRLHKVAGDRGGQTYAGIARNHHPDWQGWAIIDKGELHNDRLVPMVRGFYRVNYWQRIGGSDISHQHVAETLFDFAVNAGVVTAVKLAQAVVGVAPDGIVGPKTIAALTQADPEQFIAHYALAKIARYAKICTRDPSQKKFLLGWINRALVATV